MDTTGDPGFVYHKTMAQVWALLILELADKELLPFDLIVYADAVKDYVGNLESYATAKGPKDPLNLTSLYQAANDFNKNAVEFHAWNRAWEDAVRQGYETSMLYRTLDARLRIRFCVFRHSSMQYCIETPARFYKKNADSGHSR